MRYEWKCLALAYLILPCGLTIIRTPDLADSQTEPRGTTDLVSEIIGSLVLYETWISSECFNSDGVRIETGYPPYVSGIAELYRGLTEIVSDATLKRLTSYSLI